MQQSVIAFPDEKLTLPGNCSWKAGSCERHGVLSVMIVLLLASAISSYLRTGNFTMSGFRWLPRSEKFHPGTITEISMHDPAPERTLASFFHVHLCRIIAQVSSRYVNLIAISFSETSSRSITWKLWRKVPFSSLLNKFCFSILSSSLILGTEACPLRSETDTLTIDGLVSHAGQGGLSYLDMIY